MACFNAIVSRGMYALKFSLGRLTGVLSMRQGFRKFFYILYQGKILSFDKNMGKFAIFLKRVLSCSEFSPIRQRFLYSEFFADGYTGMAHF